MCLPRHRAAAYLFLVRSLSNLVVCGSGFMKELKYWEQRDVFAPFQEYFGSRSEFDAFVRSITADEEKSRFLNVASFYKFLVKDGRFTVPGYEETKYFDETYRFVALV